MSRNAARTSAIVAAIALGFASVSGAKAVAQDDAALAQATAVLGRTCTDPTMAALFVQDFNQTSASSTRLTAVGVSDPADVATDSALAKDLDVRAPRPPNSVAMRYCKARVLLSNNRALPEVFRIDATPDGRTPVVGAILTAALFDDTALSQSSPAPRTRSAAAINVAPRVLPLQTVLCTDESDYTLRQEDMESPTPTHRIGPSCFFLEAPTTFEPIGSGGRTMAQVRLSGGPHSGTIAWTDRALVNR